MFLTEYKKLLNIKLLLPLGLLLFFIGGCTGPFKQANLSASEFYRSPGVDNIGNNRIGFLRAAVSRGSGLAEYKVAVSDIIENVFRREKAGVNIIASREAINNINSAGLTKVYAEMLDYYDMTGILNKNILEKISEAMNVRYIAQPRLMSFTETTSIRLSALGLALISTRETTVKVSLQIWDASTGNIIWEGSGQATIAVEAMRASPVTFEEVAEAASSGLVNKLIF